MSDKKRLLEIKQFLAEKCGVKNFSIEKMSLDASSRQYYRIFFNDGSTKIILDDKNHKNKSKEFVSLSSFLRKNDIIAPKIFAKCLRRGLILIEDFGNSDFVQKLKDSDEKYLLKQAVDVLVKLHKVKEFPVFVPYMDKKVIADNFALFTDWYIPACLNKPLSPQQRKEFFDIIERFMPLLNNVSNNIVLWDYHVNNVMFPKKYSEAAVIDFQDAMLGCGLYDLVSLLEDERSDFSLMLVDELKKYYVNQSGVENINDFEKIYAFMALLRHMRVLGRFTTLITVNHKTAYAKYIPHGLELLKYTLNNPMFCDLKKWMNNNFPEKNWKVVTDKNISKAFILAAGRGTRMRHLTDKKAKPMIKVAGRHLIDYSFDLLKNAQINDVVVNVCWQKEGIKKYLATIKDFNITISEEDKALETGGGIKKVLRSFDNKPFVVINADNILIDDGVKSIVRQMQDVWSDEKHDVLLLLTDINNVYGDAPKYGDYKISGDIILRNKDKVCGDGFDYGYVGIALLHPRIFENSPKGAFSLREIFDKAESLGRLGYALSDRYEFWVGTPEAVIESEQILMRNIL